MSKQGNAGAAGDDAPAENRNKSTADVAAQKRERKLSLGKRRVEWLALVAAHAANKELKDFDVRAANRLAWAFMDRTSGTTQGTLMEWAADIKASPRGVQKTIARFLQCQLLVKIADHARDRPNKYRMNFPAPAARPAATKPTPKPKPPVDPYEGQTPF